MAQNGIIEFHWSVRCAGCGCGLSTYSTDPPGYLEREGWRLLPTTEAGDYRWHCPTCGGDR